MTHLFRLIKKLLWINIMFISFLAHASETELSIGWESWPPYQYKEGKIAKGLDVDILNAVLEHAKIKYTRREIPRAKQLEELEKGTIDIITSTARLPEIEKYAYISEAFRKESPILLIKTSEKANYSTFKKISDLYGSKLRVGATKGYYYGEEYAKLAEQKTFMTHVDLASSDQESFRKVMEKRLDGLLSDRFLAQANIKKLNLQGQLLELFELHSHDVFILLSKKSLKKEVFEKINESLATIKKNGTLDGILNAYSK